MQVITQLRAVRKTTKGESDSAIAERDDLRALCSGLQGDLSLAQQRVAALTAAAESAGPLREQLTLALESLSICEHDLDASRRKVAQLESEIYSKDAELEVTRADILLVRQELERRYVEISNLNDAVAQVEAEKTFNAGRHQRDLAEKIEEIQTKCAEESAAALQDITQRLRAEQERCATLQDASQEYELQFRKAEMDFNKEKKKMQRTLENALTQLNNSQQDVVDRMLVANLIVNYLKKRR
jgi:chromosome segregation ATPase